MTNFYITISKGLLEGKHRQLLKENVWLYLWLLDRITKIEDGHGYVLGGKPIVYEDLKDLDIPIRTYRRWVKKLEVDGYIRTLRTPRGLVIVVLKAKKAFGTKDKGSATDGTSDMPRTAHHMTLDGTSNIRQYNRQYSKTLPPIIPLKKFTSLEEITEDDILEIATKYQVKPGFVRLQLEKMKNWTEAKGKKYKNYKKALMNWVLSDIQKHVERRVDGTSKVSIDTTNI